MRSVFLSKKQQPQCFDSDSDQSHIQHIKQSQDPTPESAYEQAIRALNNKLTDSEILTSLQLVKSFSIQNQIFEPTAFDLLITHLTTQNQSIRAEIYKILAIFIANSNFEPLVDIITYMRNNAQADHFLPNFISLLTIILAVDQDSQEEIIVSFAIYDYIQSGLQINAEQVKIQLRFIEMAELLTVNEVAPEGFLVEDVKQLFQATKSQVLRNKILQFLGVSCTSIAVRNDIKMCLGVFLKEVNSDNLRYFMKLLEGLCNGSVKEINDTYEVFQVYDVSGLMLEGLQSQNKKVVIASLNLIRTVLNTFSQLFENEELIFEQIFKLTGSANRAIWTTSLLVLEKVSTKFKIVFGLEKIQSLQHTELSGNGVVVICKFIDSQCENGVEWVREDFEVLIESINNKLGQPIVYQFAQKYGLGEFQDDDILW